MMALLLLPVALAAIGNPGAEANAGAELEGGGARCPSADRAIGDGTLPLGAAGADFGAVPEACLRTDGWLRLRASLLVAAEAPDYYGSVAAGGGVRLRYALGPRWALTFAFDAATYRFVQNAVVSSTGIGVGPATLGVTRTLGARERWKVALFSRALVPLDTARTGWLLGGDAGAAAMVRGARPWLGLQGGVLVGVPVAITGGRVHPAVQAAGVVEAWASGPRVAGTLGAFARMQIAPELERSGALGLRAGGRLGFRGALTGFSLAAVTEIPFVGGDRTDLLLALFAGYTPAASRPAAR
jgi:hypothetical protein